MPHQKKSDTQEVIELYLAGYSCGDIARMFSMSRQAVWERLTRSKVKLRTKKVLPFVVYDGIKFTPRGNGYYRATSRDKNLFLHRYIYEKEVGIIPEGYDIHHIDFDRQNNRVDNLECISKSEHTSKYSPGHNQYKNKKTIASGEWKK